MRAETAPSAFVERALGSCVLGFRAQANLRPASIAAALVHALGGEAALAIALLVRENLAAELASRPNQTLEAKGRGQRSKAEEEPACIQHIADPTYITYMCIYAYVYVYLCICMKKRHSHSHRSTAPKAQKRTGERAHKASTSGGGALVACCVAPYGPYSLHFCRLSARARAGVGGLGSGYVRVIRPCSCAHMSNNDFEIL